MSRPLLLDLFCGAGGASAGYVKAGFDVIGMDINKQPDYPFEFIQADIMEYDFFDLFNTVDAIHASPPCQLFSRAGKLREAQGGKASTIDLLTPIRPVLQKSGLPYIIENVQGSPLIDPVQVCGSYFGLMVRRHRLFESNLPLKGTTCHHKTQGRPVGVYHVMGDSIPSGGRTAKTLEEGQAAMGINWMPWKSLKEAIPPAYTRYLGQQVVEILNG